jgi:hypothetical protein
MPLHGVSRACRHHRRLCGPKEWAMKPAPASGNPTYDDKAVAEEQRRKNE